MISNIVVHVLYWPLFFLWYMNCEEFLKYPLIKKKKSPYWRWFMGEMLYSLRIHTIFFLLLWNELAFHFCFLRDYSLEATASTFPRRNTLPKLLLLTFCMLICPARPQQRKRFDVSDPMVTACCFRSFPAKIDAFPKEKSWSW